MSEAAIQQVAARLEAVEEALAATARTAAAAGGQPAAVRAWWWPGLDAAEATAAWAQLGKWVHDALLARHPRHGDVLRPCWRAHPDVVDELSALYVAWHDAYASPRPGPPAATDYLNRLPVVLARIDAAFTAAGCRAEPAAAHRDPTTRRALFIPWDTARVAEFVAADATRRQH